MNRSSNSWVMTNTVDIDFSGLTQILKNATQANTKHIRIGWINGKKYPAKHKNKGLYIAQVAMWQEFGTKNIFPRPVLSKTLGTIKNDITPYIREYFQNVCNPRKFFDYTPLNSMAQVAKTNFKNMVMAQGFRRLADSTVRIKGHDFILDHTGHLLNNFDAKVYKTSVDKIDARAR